MSSACLYALVHLVAVVLLERVELAERAVLDEVVDHDAQPRPPRALDPLPVGALVGQRLVARPAGEARPSLGLWVPTGRAAGEEVLDHRARAVGVVVGAVLQRHGHAVRAPRPPAVEARRRGTGTRRGGCGRRGSRARAPSGSMPLNGLPVTLTSTSGKVAQPWAGAKRPARVVEATWTSRPSASDAEVPAGGHVREPQRAAHVGDAPVRRAGRAWWSAATASSAAGARHAPVGPVEQVAAERGRLHAERAWRRPRVGAVVA